MFEELATFDDVMKVFNFELPNLTKFWVFLTESGTTGEDLPSLNL